MQNNNRWGTVSIIASGNRVELPNTNELYQLIRKRFGPPEKIYFALSTPDETIIFINDKLHKKIPTTANKLHFLNENTLLTNHFGTMKVWNINDQTFSEYNKTFKLARRDYIVRISDKHQLISENIKNGTQHINKKYVIKTGKFKAVNNITFLSAHHTSIYFWDYRTLTLRAKLELQCDNMELGFGVVDVDYLDKTYTIIALQRSVQVWDRLASTLKQKKAFENVISLNKIDDQRVVIQYQENAIVKVAVWNVHPLKKAKTLSITNYAGVVTVHDNVIAHATHGCVQVYNSDAFKLFNIKNKFVVPSCMTLRKFQ